ncbi:MAG: hypothetical protein KGK08_14935 [Acidobacteriota bacterium]|nr:hypothetical protein [Acidobacteriota bacterium]
MHKLWDSFRTRPPKRAPAFQPRNPLPRPRQQQQKLAPLSFLNGSLLARRTGSPSANSIVVVHEHKQEERPAYNGVPHLLRVLHDVKVHGVEVVSGAMAQQGGKLPVRQQHTRHTEQKETPAVSLGDVQAADVYRPDILLAGVAWRLGGRAVRGPKRRGMRLGKLFQESLVRFAARLSELPVEAQRQLAEAAGRLSDDEGHEVDDFREQSTVESKGLQQERLPKGAFVRLCSACLAKTPKVLWSAKNNEEARLHWAQFHGDTQDKR